MVAARIDDPTLILALWALGGLVVLMGALCYAELASNDPDTGGEYRFLVRAWGPATGFLFAWGRLAVVQTGAIAAVAFVIGDYAHQLLPLGSFGPALYAALAVITMTAFNVCGTHMSTRMQNLLATILIGSVLVVATLGFLLPANGVSTSINAVPTTSEGQSMLSALSVAMIFIMLTYGGWNEAAYLTAELRESRKSITRVFVWGTIVVTALYLFLNAAYLHVLGPAALRASETVGADYMQALLGRPGAVALSLLVLAAAITTLNATIFTGARSACAMGKDVRLFEPLGRWNDRAQGPVHAHIFQALLVLLLIGVGGATRQGFSSMVEFTAPVFWFFLFLTGLSLFVMRRRGLPSGGFRVPFYPLTPILFCTSSLFMLHASLIHTGAGALLGIAILLMGLPLWFLTRRTVTEF
jgi:amino acid transporter